MTRVDDGVRREFEHLLLVGAPFAVAVDRDARDGATPVQGRDQCRDDPRLLQEEVRRVDRDDDPRRVIDVDAARGGVGQHLGRRGEWRLALGPAQHTEVELERRGRRVRQTSAEEAGEAKELAQVLRPRRGVESRELRVGLEEALAEMVGEAGEPTVGLPAVM